MEDLDELDSERLNELESILYASVHYSDGLDVVEPPASDQDGRSMPPPLQQQKDSPFQQPLRVVSGTRVINNAKPKPRYWAGETVAGGQVEEAAAPNKTNSDTEVNATSSQQGIEKPKRPPITPNKGAPNPNPNKTGNQQPKQKSKKQQQNHQQKQQQKQQNNQKSKQQQNQKKKQQQNQPKEKVPANASPAVQKPKTQASSTTTTISTPVKTNHEAYEEERFDQRLLVAIPPNCPPKKQNKQQQEPQKKQQEPPQNKKQQQQSNKQQQNKQQQNKQQTESGPQGKANRKLELLKKLAAKKQKSKQAQFNKKQRSQNPKPVEFVDLAESSHEGSDDDDVVHVPLSPPPIIDLDPSDEELPSGSPLVYHEEDAMDATHLNVVSSGETQSVQPDARSGEGVPPSLISPSNSVLSSDDFIVQKDITRLQADKEKSSDKDLLVLTENAIRESLDRQENEPEQGPSQVDAPQTADPDPAADPDTCSEYEFVPPSRLEEIKKNYRVDEQQFRALDVYESESDLTESGVYSKAKSKTVPTIIRNVDSPSGNSSVEEVVEAVVQKTKRLRKRSMSTNNHSQSEGNNDEDDSDSDDGVHSTGVPGIARGMAVERCKRKIPSSSQKSGARIQKPKPLVNKEASSAESASEDEVPSAREIAERLLKQEEGQTNRPANPQPSTDEVLDSISIGSDADEEGEAEFNDAMTDRITAVFERIDAQSRKSQDLDDEEASGYISSNEDDSRDVPADTTVSLAEDVEMEAALELQGADPEPGNEDVSMEESDIQIDHNLPALTDDSPPSGGDLIGWNDEMCRFYNDSWRGEHFSVTNSQRAMSANRNEWRLRNADRFPVSRPRSHAKCTNCLEMGHVRSKCPRPRKPPVCFMCGEMGHAEPRCPNALCFGCGSKQEMYVQQCNKCTFHSRLVCQLCRLRGHGMDHCPDKWRRYHSTTQSNVELNSNVHYKSKQCSYCAGRGHLFENCRQRIGEYRNTNLMSQIVTHQKVYPDRNDPTGDLGNLNDFFDIETPFHFQWSKQSIPKASYYAKFLVHANLARMQSVKRKPTTVLEELPAKVFTREYVPNPLAKAASGNANKSAAPPKEQTPETPAVEEQTVEAQPPEETSDPIQREEISTNFETQQNDTTKAKTVVPPHDIDSDSNYSFSEHFEVPSSTTTENRKTSVPQRSQLPPDHPMASLPDVIPLSSVDDDFEEPSTSYQGISMCVNANPSNSGRKSEAAEPKSGEEPLPDVPCEGKILMARDQSEYLFSPEGREFLSTTAKQCQVSVRMDLKDYGYVLVIYGLKEKQEELQLKLLRRNQEVKRKTIEFQSQKPPKRIDVLIRFMRDGINSLTSNLGNASNHYLRIKELEDMNTKNGFKMAEKKRRQLNMILVGQAGLLNGTTHLDQLLVLLRKLMDLSPDDNATPELRNEIDEHWRMIFTSYPHPNYDSLLQSYGKLDQKNRVPSLHIDPVLLGLQPNKKSVQSAPSSPGKRPSSPIPPAPAWTHMAPPPPPKIPKKKQRQVVQQQQQEQQQRLQQQQQQQQQRLQQQQQQQQRMQQQQQQQQQQQNNQQMQFRRPQNKQMPFNNPQQRSRADLHLHQNLNPECDRLFKEMDQHGNVDKDADKPSMFWSRESLKYLDDLFKRTSSPDTTERLNRVLQRSERGQLSFNDYRAVIRLHTILSK
ncbi:uncharacterized protein Dana_GF23935 [Drosophila ananassae]|uniref:Zinc finger CCHC domain-containing protein 7 n=1 Tax=Drosophila ananassae TaxID=7217 RepID=B3M465_DROAN|nr:uncharacterized protein LOC6506571 [Drosophila ananassae]EDV40427.2 uncharacterized protein Dana_GF23935 [Drosophila ananassae]